jgi:signal transduction histidine kinase
MARSSPPTTAIAQSPNGLKKGMKDKKTPLSFRVRFLLSTIIATLVIPTIAAVIFFQGELSSSKDLILNDSVSLAENIAKQLYPTLAFEDLESAEDALEGLQNDPQINHSSIWKKVEGSSDGEFELFCSTREESVPQKFSFSKNGETWTDSALLIVRSIQSSDDEQPIGKIVIERSLAHLEYKKSQFKRLGFTSWTFMIIIMLCVTIWYQNTLTLPLQELTNVAEKISSESNYSLRAKKISADEFGKLTDLFNEMLDSINDTNEKLLVANLHMEQRVQNRTKQLTLTNEKLLSEIKERERSNKELIETRDRLNKQEKLASVGQVSSNIAHELRNPMAAIRNSTYFLRLKNKGDDKSSHHLEIIDRELSRSDEVIQRLLQLTKSGTLKKQSTDLRKLAGEAMIYSNVAGNANLSINFSPKYFPVTLDRILFRQVLYNLFMNAIQAMPNGGDIGMEVRKLENGRILICVSDQGVGIDEVTMRKIFEPLFTSKEEGVGLGLSLCRELVTRHGGSIKAKSSPDQGTTIEIELPSENSVAQTEKPV